MILRNKKTGRVYANTEYTLLLADKSKRKGRTNAEGLLTESGIPAGKRLIKIHGK
jgi:hypothetical protein